jgi:halogenation protein CepH
MGWTAKEVIFEGGRAVGVLAGPNGKEAKPIQARVTIDATGRDCLLARKLGWRKPDPALSKVSHFTHFKGGFRRDAKDVVKDLAPVLPSSSATDIHTVEGGWIWYIPLKNDIVSVGAVLDAKYAGSLPGGPQEKFDAALKSCARLSQWLQGAEQKMEMQTISSISYLNERFAGDGFVLVGDAAMFIDPIFSAGVTLATRAGVYAGEQILECFGKNDFSAAALAPYEARIKHPMGAIFKMIYNWYQILERKDANNLISLSRRAPLLRERLIVLLSGGYDKMDLERIRAAAAQAA